MPTVQILSQKTNDLQIRRIQTQWTITCGCNVGGLLQA